MTNQDLSLKLRTTGTAGDGAEALVENAENQLGFLPNL